MKVEAKAEPKAEAQKENAQKETELHRITGELNRAGPIAVVDVRSGSGILKGTILAERPEIKVVAVPPTRRKPTAPKNLRDDPVLNEQYQGAFTAIEGCHVDVARRLHVPPAEVEADSVTLRWTIEPSGHTRDIEAVASSGTDPAVVTCAELVLANWALLSPVAKRVTVERTHSFRKLAPVALGLRER